MRAVSQYHRDENRPQEDGIVILEGVTWADYERLLEIRGDHSAPQPTSRTGSNIVN